MGDATVSEDGRFDLRSHSARRPGLSALIREVTLMDGSGRPTTTFNARGKFQAELLIKAPSRVREPRIALAIEDYLGRRIMTVASYFAAGPFTDLTGEHRIRCTIPELSLGEGRYLFSVSIAQKGTDHLDSVDGAGWFDVRWNNSYGNGEAYAPAYGPVLAESQWREIS